MQIEFLIRIIITVINCLFGSTVHTQTTQEYEKEKRELFLAEENACEEKKHLEASWLKLQKERQLLEERAETEHSLRVKEAEAHRQQVKDFHKALSGQNFQAKRRDNENKKLKEEISKLQMAREKDEATHQAERKRLQKRITQSEEATASLNKTIEKLKNEHEFEIFYKNCVIKSITRQATAENERRKSEAEAYKEEIEDLSEELANCMNKYLVLLQRVKDSQAKRVSVQVQTEPVHATDASCGTDTVTTADVSCGTETITFADASCGTDIATTAEVACGTEDINITQEAPTPISYENNRESSTKCPLCHSSINKDAHMKEDATHRAPSQKTELTSETPSGDSQKAAEDTTWEATTDFTSDFSESISTDEATQEDKDEEKDPTDDYDPMDMSDGEHRETVELIHHADEIADEDIEPFERPSPPPTFYEDVPPGTELTPLRYLSELFHLFPYGRNRLVETLEPLYEFSDFAAEGDGDDVDHIEAVREYYTSHRKELEKPEHMLKKHMEWTGHLYNSFKREMRLQNRATATYRDMAELYEQFIEENHDLIPLYEDCLLWKEKLMQRQSSDPALERGPYGKHRGRNVFAMVFGCFLTVIGYIPRGKHFSHIGISFNPESSPTAAAMLKSIVFCILLVSSAVAQTSAQANANFALSTSDLLNQLSYQSSSASNVRTFSQFNLGNSITSNSASVSTGSGSASINDIFFQSSPSGLIWGVLGANVNGNGNFGNGAFDFSASLITSAFNPLAIVYYTDKNGNNVYDEGEELQAPTKTYSLSYNTNTQLTTNSGSAGIQVNSQVSGTFNFRYTVANKPYVNQGVNVKDDTTKIDIQINPNYPANAPSNTRVALVAFFGVLQSSSSFHGSASNGNATFNGKAGISFSNNGNNGGLSWAGSASVTSSSGASSSANVATSALQVHGSASVQFGGASLNVDSSYKNTRVLVFNFQSDKPASIYWDPQLGASTGSASAIVVSFMMIAILAIFF
ncbi:hypothetical protein PROFUN_04392 [Planoprotostelium fungivorum]|uniref:Uncharacterized protein n=1 Tax=Planoprotostelium fungivorum TaxID=1890364 RepID=A0A2P6NHT9_9EUKA|nr:hypothetical protein PROFUN_04392 [Planoprotostelium fungivorum]